MTTKCDNNNIDEMDAYSIARRDSENIHCFYQNRGKNKNLKIFKENSNHLMSSTATVIQPLLTGRFIKINYAQILQLIRNDKIIFNEKLARFFIKAPIKIMQVEKVQFSLKTKVNRVKINCGPSVALFKNVKSPKVNF